ncbi:GntR family transcriptional regulator [Aureimonas sp. SK2]|uniref:GntR family transcriptional regulator n=1 Tax=Aureimonas sp. SK2 TaxID=3015992 RepID=UPI0024446726|nr:GntR family transcriptional regulator [Aureimonas sp. SK2]
MNIATTIPLPPISLPEPLADLVVERLRSLIVTEELEAGTRLRERQLAERLGVSRTPLRDALKVLAAEGLVRIEPKRGAMVRHPSPAEIEEKLSVLAVLEGFAGECAARMATDAEISAIGRLQDELTAAFERQDRADYFRINQDIHRSIVAAARNETLAAVHMQLNAQLAFYRWKGSADLELWNTAIAEHATLLELLQNRDATGLAEALRTHVASTWREMRRRPSPA